MTSVCDLTLDCWHQTARSTSIRLRVLLLKTGKTINPSLFPLTRIMMLKHHKNDVNSRISPNCEMTQICLCCLQSIYSVLHVDCDWHIAILLQFLSVNSDGKKYLLYIGFSVEGCEAVALKPLTPFALRYKHLARFASWMISKCVEHSK